MLPVDRMRRFVTPVDIDGSGRVLRWGVPWPRAMLGPTPSGGSNFAGYFRPPGAPGLISVALDGGAAPGTIVYPSAQNDLFYTSGPNPANLTFPSYLPDVTNNPLHGFEAAKNPNLPDANGNYSPQDIGGMPADQNLAAGIPDWLSDLRPQYPHQRAERGRRDEPLPAQSAAGFRLRPRRPGMALPAAGRRRRLAVEPAGRPGPGQLHQHHRRPRRRRLFAVESWESNNFVWANDNPRMRSRSTAGSRRRPARELLQLGDPALIPVVNGIPTSTPMQPGLPTPRWPTATRRSTSIIPCRSRTTPTSRSGRNGSADTYQLLKWILPPRAVDTPEELAQLSQFVINIIDFRDPGLHDDPLAEPGRHDGSVQDQPANGPGQIADARDGPTAGPGLFKPATPSGLDQYGMEYNPVALNEVLAFSYAYSQGGGSQANRFFVELVNTLTQSAFAALPAPGGTNPPDPSILDLSGFQYTPGDPYSGGCWDLVFTDDTPNSRPDPYRGELVPGGQFYALIPLTKDSFTASAAGAAAGNSSSPGSDVTLVPLGPRRASRAIGGQPGGDPAHAADELLLRLRQQPGQPGVRDGDTVAHDLLSPPERDRSQDAFAGAIPQPRGRPVQRDGDPEDHLVPGRAAGGRCGLGTASARRPTISRSSPP